MQNVGLQSKKVFLSAEWRNLLLFNYSVSAKVLEPFLPQGAELDLREGRAHLSLVAFQFLGTRVLGIQWPGFTNFPEINLRFYVKYKGERGVCFVREYVPSRWVAQIARWTYNEPYKRAVMEERVVEARDLISAEYKLSDGPFKMRFYAKAEKNPLMPSGQSLEHYFKEHELGIGQNRQGHVQTYRVHHPQWQIYPLIDYDIQVDARGLYGESFEFLEKQKPASVVFAVGSEIKVFFKDDKNDQ